MASDERVLELYSEKWLVIGTDCLEVPHDVMHDAVRSPWQSREV